MSYGFDLVRLPAGGDRDEAYQRKLEADEAVPLNEGPIDPAEESEKRRLAAALMARHATLKLYQRDYATSAEALGVDEAEARRRLRNLELNDRQHGIQIQLFDDSAGVSLSPPGDAQSCARALRVAWDCLKVLESQGGFSTHDPQVGRVLDLKSDFAAVLKCACGVDQDPSEGASDRDRKTSR